MEGKVSFSDRHVIFKEGAPSGKLYVVRAGEVLCLKSSKDRLIPVFKAGPNDIIGESAILKEHVYTYSAVSIGEVELIEIPSTNFTKVLELSPNWLSELTLTMVQRYQNTAKLIAENRIVASDIIDEEVFNSAKEVEFKKLLAQ